jgi:hypothetical protein
MMVAAQCRALGLTTLSATMYPVYTVEYTRTRTSTRPLLGSQKMFTKAAEAAATATYQ